MPASLRTSRARHRIAFARPRIHSAFARATFDVVNGWQMYANGRAIDAVRAAWRDRLRRLARQWMV